MGFLRRDRRTLNERLLDDLESDSSVRAHDAREPEAAGDEAPGAGTTAGEPHGYWDAVLEVMAAGLREDSYEFASLENGDLIVEENVDEPLSALADAVDAELEPPYRAVAVRQGPEWWTVSARRIQVAPLDVEAEYARLTSEAGQLRLEVDGKPVENHMLLATLAEHALALGDDYVVDALHLDGGMWELRAMAVPAHTTKIDASSDVVRYVLEHGGKLYVWSNDAGLVECATELPGEPIQFTRLEHEGFELYQDERIEPPPVWRLAYKRVPEGIEARRGDEDWAR